ncbi:MAG: YkgJ family cysteine cluster protein [Deltaproteobacteria bacterium]|nr:YkgJ family cysteine cluster protein [Deltaproteobacteria bacterium]MBW2218464.1 YkgJ family cysteine cluster protein [Deltaproteobacteria bacterium]
MNNGNNENNQITALGLDDSFMFSCSKQVPCFNECCRDLNQLLTPYDILCLKNSLGISSGQFLEEYTLQHTGPETGLPVVTLKPNNASNEAKCPFVTEEGCRVYSNRPGSCRTYPLARLASRSRETGEITEHYALLNEPHCQGFEEGDTRTVRKWIEDQGIAIYNEMNDLFMEIISLKNRLMPGPMGIKSRHMFHLACYDLDNFRTHLFEKGFLSGLDLGQVETEMLRNDDIELMKFGIKWVQENIFSGASTNGR